MNKNFLVFAFAVVMLAGWGMSYGGRSSRYYPSTSWYVGNYSGYRGASSMIYSWR